MSQQAFDGYGCPESGPHYTEAPRTGAFSLLAHWVGALVSISLVVGLGVWSYRLTMRDVTEIPVVRAMTGPMRVAPEDPGGQIVPHLGLAVNEVQSEGTAAAPSDRVVLAPDPVRLSDEDLTLVEALSQTGESPLSPVPSNVQDVIASPVDIRDQDAINAAVLAAVNGAEISSETRNLARLPGVKRSPRPKARVRVATLEKTGSDASVVLVSAPAVDVDPSEVPSGTRLVQLGAFDDRAGAIREWNAILVRHGDLIGARKRLIQEAESGGRRFYRLRMVGFDDLSDSRRLCSALLARGTPCIPVTAR